MASTSAIALSTSKLAWLIKDLPRAHANVACRPSPLVLSEEGAKIQKRVWAEISQKLETIQPGIMANV